MAKGLRLEDWIEKKVTVNINMEPADDPEDDPEDDPDELIVEIEGFLQGVDPMGVIVLFGRGDVHTRPGPGSAQPDVPRHIFYPWRRIQSIERIEERIEDENE